MPQVLSPTARCSKTPNQQNQNYTLTPGTPLSYLRMRFSENWMVVKGTNCMTSLVTRVNLTVQPNPKKCQQVPLSDGNPDIVMHRLHE